MKKNEITIAEAEILYKAGITLMINDGRVVGLKEDKMRTKEDIELPALLQQQIHL